MAARVDDKLLCDAAEAMLRAADSLTNAAGLRIHSGMNLEKAQSAVLAAIVNCLGYPSAVYPTGWFEVHDFGKREATHGA